MKNFATLLSLLFLLTNPLFSQTSDVDNLEIAVGGSFAKPKIIPGLEKLAVAQVTVNYKVTSTAKTIDREKSTGTTAGAKFTAYLETTDRALSEGDFQEITDYFYAYLQKKLKEANIDTVGWDAITSKDFYKNESEVQGKEKTEKNESVWMTSTAHKGNVLYGGNIAFAFGKIKKASQFSSELGAVAGYFNLMVDFADLFVDLDINTSSSSNMYYSSTTEKKKYTWAVKPNMKVTPFPPNTGGFSLFWNDKNASESIFVKTDLTGFSGYADAVTEDASKMKNSMWAFRKEMKPVIIVTTTDKYKAAAKKALSDFADAFVGKVQASKKK